ncbi:hypothetical protein Tco_0228168 [Tanacetum coccineum]
MSISEDSTVTYTAVSSPFADFPDIGSPGVDGPSMMPEDPYAYVFMPLEDEILLVEEQPLPAAVSPTADSPGYDPEISIRDETPISLPLREEVERLLAMPTPPSSPLSLSSSPLP